MNNGQPNDKYAIRIYQGITQFNSGPKVAPSTDMSGETPNHTEERFCGAYGLSPDATRPIIVDWYGPGIKRRGDQAKDSTDESIFSLSHFAHYMAARGPLLLFGMKAKHQDVIDTMVNVWKGNLASFDLLSSPDQTAMASPCARLLDSSDQRQNTIGTFRWLRGRKIHQPKLIATSPDWLGLYALQAIEAACVEKQPWAMDWWNIKAEISSAKPFDVLPLKNQLIVDRSSKGHRAYFETYGRLSGTVGKWTLMDYSNQNEALYGVDDPNEKHQLEGVKLAPADQMPPLQGNDIKTYTFPVARAA